MRNLLPLFIAAILGWLITANSVRAVVITKIDDTSVTGDLVGVSGGILTIAIKSAQPSTRPSTAATTGPATQPTAAAETVTVKLSEIARVVVRHPPPKAPPVKPADPEPDVPANEDSPSVMSSVLGAFFGSSKTVTHQQAKTVPADVGAAPKASTTASSPPTENPLWQVKLSDGDLLNGRIEQSGDKGGVDQGAVQKIHFRVSAIAGASVDFSANQLAELWCTDSAARAKARALAREPGSDDVAFVRKESAVIAVKGSVLGMDADSLYFRFDDQDRKISLIKLAGVIRGEASHLKSTPKFHQRVKLDSGDELSGTWTAGTADALMLQTENGSSVRLPLSDIYTIDFLGGRMVYLSDLKPVKVEQTPYFGRVMPWRADQSLSGGPLQLSDGQYARGIAMHSRCVLEYDIQCGFERFKAKVGFEQPMGKKGNAILRLLGDGKVLYENADARGDQPPVSVDVDVTSVQRLAIEVDFGKTPEVGGRVIWADARLLRANLPK